METNSNIYALNYNEFKEFMTKIQGSTQQLKIAKECTTDISGLILTLKELHDIVEDRSTKHKLARLINRIREQLKKETEKSVLLSQDQRS